MIQVAVGRIERDPVDAHQRLAILDLGDRLLAELESVGADASGGTLAQKEAAISIRHERTLRRRQVNAITQRMAEHTITHVSDTARWTALHRATESARPDALFSDPLAERLAGEQGRAIAANVPWRNRSGWWLVARTKSIDDAIANALAVVATVF